MGMFHFHIWDDWYLLKAVEHTNGHAISMEIWQQRRCATCNFIQVRKSEA